MGWSFSLVDTGRQTHIDSITSQAHFSPDYTPLEHRVVGNHVWQLVRHNPTGRTFITLDMIAKERNGGWGYKGLSEDMGPTAVDCPLALINKASPPEGYAVAWRERVRQYHADKKARSTHQSGDVVTYGSHQYRLDCPAGPRKGWRVTRVSDGCVFRMNSRQLSQATA